MIDKKHSEYSKEQERYSLAKDIVSSLDKTKEDHVKEKIYELRGRTDITSRSRYGEIHDMFLLLTNNWEYYNLVFGPRSYRRMSNGNLNKVWVAAAFLSGNLEKLVGVQFMPQLLQHQENQEQPNETASS